MGQRSGKKITTKSFSIPSHGQTQPLNCRDKPGHRPKSQVFLGPFCHRWWEREKLEQRVIQNRSQAGEKQGLSTSMDSRTR